jgi:ribonuclease PH
MNFVMTDKQEFIEVQGTAEHAPFSQRDLLAMMDLAVQGCQDLFKHQQEIIGDFFPLKLS